MNDFSSSPDTVFVEVDKSMVPRDYLGNGVNDKLRALTDEQMQLAFAVVEKVAAQAATTLQTLWRMAASPCPTRWSWNCVSFQRELQAYFAKSAGEATNLHQAP